MDLAYKHAKEAFVSDAAGSSITHINLISAVSFLSLGIHVSVAKTRPGGQSNFLIEWTVLVMPLVLSVTLFAGKPAILLSCVLLAQWPLARLWNMQRASTASGSTEDLHPKSQLAALTSYRAHMMLLTVLAILAVDFPVFPRYLAKCESFGTSLMDLGVGSFVFSQGVISALPLLKDPRQVDSPVGPKLVSASRKVLPVVVLGVIRVLLVKGTDYPEHVTEYGVHWNFFLTLAVLPLLQVLLHPLIARVSIPFVALTLAVVYQLCLSMTPLQGVVLHGPRSNVFMMNKEGLGSLPGYLAIHLLGLQTGTVVVPPSPSHFSRLRAQIRNVRHEPSYGESTTADCPAPERRENGKTVTELLAYALLWWTLIVGIVFYAGNTAVSRRLANLPYVLWIAAYNTTALAIYIILGASAAQVPPPPKATAVAEPDLHEPPVHHEHPAPALFEAINRNSLVLFLLANLLTGAVNLSMRTMYAGDTVAMSVLLGYSLVVCYAAWALRDTRLIRM